MTQEMICSAWVMAQAWRGDTPVYLAAVPAPLIGLCGDEKALAALIACEVLQNGYAVIQVDGDFRFEVSALKVLPC